MSCSIEIGHSFIVRRIFTISFELKALWILLTCLSSLHLQASLWLNGAVTDSHLQIISHCFEKIILLCHFFFSSRIFLSTSRLQNFLFTNLIIVVFGLPLPILSHPSISLFSTVRFIDLHILSTLCSRCSCDTVAGIFWISMLFLLVY